MLIAETNCRGNVANCDARTVSRVIWRLRRFSGTRTENNRKWFQYWRQSHPKLHCSFAVDRSENKLLGGNAFLLMTSWNILPLHGIKITVYKARLKAHLGKLDSRARFTQPQGAHLSRGLLMVPQQCLSAFALRTPSEPRTSLIVQFTKLFLIWYVSHVGHDQLSCHLVSADELDLTWSFILRLNFYLEAVAVRQLSSEKDELCNFPALHSFSVHGQK